MTRHRRSLGREGEERAARHLEARGYQIVARNVRAGGVEMDVIATDRHALVFVEVKARRADTGGGAAFGSHAAAAESVDRRKQARLRRGAAAWLSEHPETRTASRRVRFDVITCLREDRVGVRGPRNDDTAHPEDARWSIEHWEAAF